MTDPTPTPQPATPAGDMAITVELLINPVFYRRPRFTPAQMIDADAFEQLAHGDRAAALGTALSVLLDLFSGGYPAEAARTLVCAQLLTHRIVAARDELGLQS